MGVAVLPMRGHFDEFTTSMLRCKLSPRVPRYRAFYNTANSEAPNNEDFPLDKRPLAVAVIHRAIGPVGLANEQCDGGHVTNKRDYGINHENRTPPGF